MPPCKWWLTSKHKNSWAINKRNLIKMEETSKTNEATQFGLDDVSNWHSLEVPPPDDLIEVQDKNGNIAKAYPTYYNVKLVENKSGRKGECEVIPCEPFWDGGWLIECEDIESNIDSKIVRWRACC